MASALSSFRKAVAFISGGATGLGRATASAIVQNGGKVAILDTDFSAGSKLSAELGENCKFTEGSVTDRAVIKRALQSGSQSFGQNYNLCVNCAAKSDFIKIFNKKHGKATSFDVFWKPFQVNTIGTFNVMTLFVSEVQSYREATEENGDENDAVIINKTFLIEGTELVAAYASSKGAVKSMTLPASRELSTLGIRVCSISTGFFNTEKLKEIWSPNTKVNYITGRIHPKFRMPEPEEFAHAVATVFQNKLLNGCDIKLDNANFLVYA
ncbi:3-hydroxyacyl-CoA dehydrogenase type-2-like [Convolutriloba macropyga]|uniref:3-hydroxyacyl-CoA dehydrogenase type-2-like n=1 Tax=Convolutriloba macropyga TaxID=536237 RepID=UPI003F51B838